MRPSSLFLSVLLLWSASAGMARAQFTQPPPRTPPPSCDRLKEGDDHKSDCKALRAMDSETFVDCQQQPGQWLSCVTVTMVYGSDGWTALDPSTLTHFWDYVQDGQRYYLWPTYSDVIAVGCGHARRGQVHVEVYGSSAATDFVCSGDPIGPDPLAPGW
jgi:hypothetical protein